jgi:hypothetical protein
MVCDPHWTTYLLAMLTPLIAMIVAFIAFRQWRTAQNRLKLDLFDRRLALSAERMPSRWRMIS